MDESKEEKVLSKEQLKLRAQEMKLEEKQRKLEEKVAIKEEKERIKNSFGRKIRNFFIGIIFVVILLLVGFYFAQKFLTDKEKELSDEKMSQIYKNAQSNINAKQYKESIELLKSIDKNYSKYSDVEEKLEEAYQLYLNEYLTEADNYLKSEKYEKAIKVLDNIEEEYKNEKIVEEKKTSIKVAQLQSEAKEMAEKKTALKMIEYLTKYDTEDNQEIEDVVNDLIIQYRNDFILETRELLKTDLKKAKTNINTALKLLPKDKDIKQLEQELKTTEENNKKEEKEN